MVRELEVVFLLNAITIEVRVMGQLLVLLQQLRRIAASPAVDSVDLLTALLAIVTAATPTVVTTIIIQGLFLKTQGIGLFLSGRSATRHMITDRPRVP
jgi:hypothetical protein